MNKDADKCVSMYVEDKMRPADIAEKLGRNKSWVYRVLKAREIPLRDGRKEIELSTHCRRGIHEFTPENTKLDERGNRHCRACDRTYQMIKYYSTVI